MGIRFEPVTHPKVLTQGQTCNKPGPFQGSGLRVCAEGPEESVCLVKGGGKGFEEKGTGLRRV